jgi:hypothetical protein
MSLQTIPVSSTPGQVFSTSVTINGAVQSFNCALSFNEIAEYWVLDIFDGNNNLLLSGVPLVTGLNLLRQYQYLGIGSIYLLNITGVNIDSPNSADLGTDFALLWSDNTVIPAVA